MATLISYGKEIKNVFQLLGDKENDITSSICWALARCPEFLEAVVKKICGIIPDVDSIVIRNQEYEKGTGITDIEVSDTQNFHIVFEAKRGWILPGSEQLTKYSLRPNFALRSIPEKHIVSLSECSSLYAESNLPFHEINGIPVSHLSFAELYQLAIDARPASTHAQNHMIDEFTGYLGGTNDYAKTRFKYGLCCCP